MRVEWPSLVGALRHVEGLRQTDSGILSFGESPVGGIFVEQGRVCWVAARGLQRRLRDLLRAHSSLSTADLERMYERCRSEGRLLGETLVAEGVIQPAELQQALRRHSAECLVDICRSSRSTSWSSHGGRGYAPRFTFRAVDLLFDSVALVYPELQAEAQRELARYAGPGRRAVAYVRADPQSELLPLTESGGNSVEHMLGLSHSLSSIPEACLELGTAPSFALSTTAGGETVLVWWRGAVLFAVSCAERASLVTLTSELLASQ